MSKKRRDVQAVVDYLLQGPDRSSLFWWLVKHHDELAEAASTKPIRWSPLAVRLASYGLTDRENKTATPETARQTWKRARKFVAGEAAAKQARALLRKQNPSRLPATWRSPASRLLETPRMRTVSANSGDEHDDRNDGGHGFVAMLIALCRLYENKRTHNVPKLLKRMADQLSPEVKSHLQGLVAQAMPIWEDAGLLRNRVFGHRSDAHAPEELFKMAKMTTDRFKQLRDVSKAIVSDLTYAWDRSTPDFSTTAREDMACMLEHLHAQRTRG